MIAVIASENSARHGRIIEAQDKLLDVGESLGLEKNGSYYLRDGRGTKPFTAEALNKVLAVLYEFQSLTEQLSSELRGAKAVFLETPETAETAIRNNWTPHHVPGKEAAKP